jgi:hypothetical protein
MAPIFKEPLKKRRWLFDHRNSDAPTTNHSSFSVLLLPSIVIETGLEWLVPLLSEI